MSLYEKLSLPNPPALPSFTKIFLSLVGLLFALSLIVTPVYPNPTSNSSKPISVPINGHSTLPIPANRALLKLEIATSGSSQTKVSDELRAATEEVLGLLEPHTLQRQRNARRQEGRWAPIVELSVNTFSSQSRKRPGLMGEKDVYEAAVSVSATFEAADERLDAPGSDDARAGFDVLSVALAKLTKIPKVRVARLSWTLAEPTKRAALAQVRTAAMQEAVDKIRAYAKPLLGENVRIRAVRFSEGWRAAEHAHDLVLMDSLGAGAAKMAMHDELGGEEGVSDMVETFALEPGMLEVRGDVEGEFEVWIPEDDALKGSLLGWLRWCHIEFSALGAKVMLRR